MDNAGMRTGVQFRSCGACPGDERVIYVTTFGGSIWEGPAVR